MITAFARVTHRICTLLLGCTLAAACDVRTTNDDHAINPWIFARAGTISPPCERLCDLGTAGSLPSCGARCEWLVETAAELDDDLGGDCSEALGAVLECASHAGDRLAAQCEPTFAVQAQQCGGEPLFDASWQACHEQCDDAMLAAEPAYPTWFECQRRCRSAPPV